MTATGSSAVLEPRESNALWFLGDLYVNKLTGDETSGAFAVTEMTIAPAPRGGAPLHTHSREDEVFYVLDGVPTYQIAERKMDAGAGTVLYVPRGTLHGFANHQQTPVKALVIIAPAGFERFFLELGEPASALTLPPAS